jgi:hypothetical protein
MLFFRCGREHTLALSSELPSSISPPVSTPSLWHGQPAGKSRCTRERRQGPLQPEASPTATVEAGTASATTATATAGPSPLQVWLQKRENSCHSLARWISLSTVLSAGITISSHTISAFIAIAATRTAISAIDIIASTTAITNITAITAFTVLTAYRAFRTFTKRVEHMITVGVAKCDGLKSNIQ